MDLVLKIHSLYKALEYCCSYIQNTEGSRLELKNFSNFTGKHPKEKASTQGFICDILRNIQKRIFTKYSVDHLQLIKYQSCHYIETSQLICSANQFTGFYMIATLEFNELILTENTTQKMKFSIQEFFSKFDQIRRKLRMRSRLLKKSLMENFIF